MLGTDAVVIKTYPSSVRVTWKGVKLTSADTMRGGELTGLALDDVGAGAVNHTDDPFRQCR